MVCHENVHLATQLGRSGWKWEDCGSLFPLPCRDPQRSTLGSAATKDGATLSPPSHCPGPEPEGTARAKPPSSQAQAGYKRIGLVCSSCALRIRFVFTSYSLRILFVFSYRNFFVAAGVLLSLALVQTDSAQTNPPSGTPKPHLARQRGAYKTFTTFRSHPGSAYANWSGMRLLPAPEFCVNNMKE